MIARLLFLVCLVAGVVTAQLAPPRKDIPAIAKAANGVIVSIITSDKNGKPVAQGTGFLVSTDGRIVTNYHVIKDASSAIVKLPDGAFYDVEGVVAFDKARDLAVIKAHGRNFRVVTLGNSDRVQVGEEIVAIGNPFSLESTVSNGIVSGIRTVEEEGGKFLQVTAPISPGSSGGPLFNMAGEVVGITTLYLKGGENLNFAIPINDAKHLIVTRFTKIQDFPDEPAVGETSVVPQEVIQQEAELQKHLPREWVNPCPADKPTCKQIITEVWFDQDTLHEAASYPFMSNASMQLDCSMKKTENNVWLGACHYNMTWNSILPGIANTVCRVETFEQVIKISASDIDGNSGHLDLGPLSQTPAKCPLAGNTNIPFELIPKPH